MRKHALTLLALCLACSGGAWADAQHEALMEQGAAIMQLGQQRQNEYNRWLVGLSSRQRAMELKINSIFESYKQQRGQVMPATEHNIETIADMVGAQSKDDLAFVDRRVRARSEYLSREAEFDRQREE